ncbi:LPS export ABC transporter periplasmic protein LptC [Robiginitalea sp. M366]|uniref:LPS export ABC transporter periplasmic protein LptC n=1 Tax=Robiginitalea aestuariiviva TaxID=3036903 RepID=UPI00240D27E9|nr:LPS export ABC transporter periplasmic protein LptC [Robiginitalea aestuariiviva]MDG1571870.1 LPS export ABC transporter periplasmic protein LptC [Robiginitalea aestuariiviva]
MQRPYQRLFLNIAMVFAMAMSFLGCEDQYKRVGEEKADPVYPQGVAQDYVLRYTETVKALNTQDSSDTRLIAVLRSPVSEDYTNLRFKYRTFPKGLEVKHYDEQGRVSTIVADSAIIYDQTNLVDLRGNVVMETFDGKRLEAEQLYWDRRSEWIFTESRFTLSNPEEGTVLNGRGMDFNRDFTYFNAHKTGGEMLVKED